MIRGQNLTHKAAHALGIAIVQGNYNNSGHLPTEAQLAEEYDISRTVMREAVKMLTAKGLITSRPRKGICVMPMSQWNMFDPDVLAWTLTGKPTKSLLKEFLQFRYAIEPRAAYLAAECPDEGLKRQIGVALEGMLLAEQGQCDPLQADIDFHVSILAASKNRFYIQLTSFIETALKFSIVYQNALKKVSHACYADHEKLYISILEGDGPKASKTVTELLDEALDLIEDASSKR